MLFVHGLFASGWVFERWLTHFAGLGHPAFALDYRGHGKSAPVASLGSVRVLDYVDDALRALRVVGPAVVVGHSMGGLVAQKLAELEAVSGAVLLAPAPARGISVLSLRLMARQMKYLPAVIRSREIRVKRKDADALILNRVPAGHRAAIFEQFEPDSGRAARDILVGSLAVDESLLRCPVTVLAGDEDRFIPLAVARRVAIKYDAPLHVIEGCGHMMMLEPNWRDVAALVEPWVAANV